MNKKRIAQYCCAALVAAGIGLNIQNAIADYGIGENSFALVAVGGSNSGSSSSTAISRASITIRHGAIASLTRSCSACTRHVTSSQLCSVCSAIWLASPLA